MRLPTSTDEWARIASGFNKKANFTHCLGAVNGKHIRLKKPLNNGSPYINYMDFFSILFTFVVTNRSSEEQIKGFRNFPEFYNYKRSFSIVLLALVDSNYNFIFAEMEARVELVTAASFAIVNCGKEFAQMIYIFRCQDHYQGEQETFHMFFWEMELLH